MTAHITRADNGSEGRYAAQIDGIEGEAELTYTRTGPRSISADHTFAPDTMRGTGVAKALLERMVLDARAEGVSITAVCTYVQAQRKRHPEWADVMAE